MKILKFLNLSESIFGLTCLTLSLCLSSPLAKMSEDNY
jgi:hypothetical protein